MPQATGSDLRPTLLHIRLHNQLLRQTHLPQVALQRIGIEIGFRTFVTILFVFDFNGLVVIWVLLQYKVPEHIVVGFVKRKVIGKFMDKHRYLVKGDFV